MSDLSNLQDRIIAFRDARDWKQFHNPKDTAISLVLEAAEFLEHFQWKSTEEIEKHLTEKRTDVENELADVLYWVLLISHDLDIDITQALGRKIQQNEAKYPVKRAKGNHKKYNQF